MSSQKTALCVCRRTKAKVPSRFLLLLLPLGVLFFGSHVVNGQRFMRQGFSNQEDFGSEMKLEDSEGAVDMTREMFLMQDFQWQLQAPTLGNLFSSSPDQLKDRALRHHLQKYLNKNNPVELKLLKKRGQFGLRAVAKTAQGKKLRAFWRPCPPPPRDSVNFLTMSYDEACRSRLFTVEFEVQLPPMATKSSRFPFSPGTSANKEAAKQQNNPCIVYRFSVEPGSVNAKALVPRSSAQVRVFPTGRRQQQQRGESGGGSSSSSMGLSVGTAAVSATPMKAGLVDPAWAKGRPVFRMGRSSGLV